MMEHKLLNIPQKYSHFDRYEPILQVYICIWVFYWNWKQERFQICQFLSAFHFINLLLRAILLNFATILLKDTRSRRTDIEIPKGKWNNKRNKNYRDKFTAVKFYFSFGFVRLPPPSPRRSSRSKSSIELWLSPITSDRRTKATVDVEWWSLRFLLQQTASSLKRSVVFMERSKLWRHLWSDSSTEFCEDLGLGLNAKFSSQTNWEDGCCGRSINDVKGLFFGGIWRWVSIWGLKDSCFNIARSRRWTFMWPPRAWADLNSLLQKLQE